MATIAWPHGDSAFGIRGMSFGGTVSKSAFGGFFAGNTQTISHLANRLRCRVVLRPCNAREAARREAWAMEVLEAGHKVQLHHLHRPEPNGSMRGTPTLAAAAASGARTLSIQSVAGATLFGGDPIGVSGQLLFAGYAGATANGAGLITLPLMWPLRDALGLGAAVTWDKPTTTFQLRGDVLDLQYGRALWQRELELLFVEDY